MIHTGGKNYEIKKEQKTLSEGMGITCVIAYFSVQQYDHAGSITENKSNEGVYPFPGKGILFRKTAILFAGFIYDSRY